MEGASSGGLSRRALLRRAGVVGAAAAVPAGILAIRRREVRPSASGWNVHRGRADTVDAMLGRLVPADESGPGAIEARVLRYVDGALSGDLAESRPAYTAGVASTDAYSRSRFGEDFADHLTASQRDVLDEMEKNVASGFSPSSRCCSISSASTRSRACSAARCTAACGFVGWDLIGFLRRQAGGDRR